LSLEDDWNRISQMTLSQKQENVYVEWVESIKKEVYIDVRK